MSYEFKKIADLERVTEVPEGANVLIETEGATKRLPSTAINNGYSKEEVYNKTEADEKYLTKETIAKPDWNQNDENAADYVKNRTHWSEELYRYIWDGNTEEKTIITPEGAPVSYVKVTNDILTAEDLIGATMIVNGVAENGFPLAPEAILDETCVFDNGDGFVYVSWEIPVVMAFDKAMSVDSIEFPSAGVYVMYVPSADPTSTPIYCSELSKTVVHKLDKKFLPDNIGGIKYVTIGMDDNDNYTASATYDEISEWIKAGLEVKCVYLDKVFSHTASVIMSDISTFGAPINMHTFVSELSEWIGEIDIEDDNSVYCSEERFVTEESIPETLPNPNALTINGVSYDGSAAVDVPAVQPDLSQNDPNAADYVKNRTHYAEEVEKVIDYLPDSDGVLDGFPRFDIGDTLVVRVDGVEHSLVAFDDGGLPTIGDLEDDIINGSGQFGWSINTYTDGVDFWALEPHTVSYTAETVHKLDYKFLPVAGLEVVMNVVNCLDDNICEVKFSKTYKEMYNARCDGRPVIIYNADWGVEFLRAFEIRDNWIQCSGFAFYGECEFHEYSIVLEDDRWVCTRVKRKMLVMED